MVRRPPLLHSCSYALAIDPILTPTTAAEAFGGYSLVWPLYVACNATTVSQVQRDWLRGRLYVIGTRFGLTGAQVLVLARRHVLTCGPMFP